MLASVSRPIGSWLTAGAFLLSAALATASAEAAPISNASFGLAGAFSVESGAHLGNNDSISNGLRSSRRHTRICSTCRSLWSA